ncbi:hypothetical protein C8R47DRAFT_1113695 [Mycena vitilis]|nr:hypothetical protein C8R47DRAFT_1113695 [Mycena vitilis]
MAEVLASLQPTEVIPGDDKLDPSGRILSLYGISSGEPLHFLLVGKLLAIQELDDGLRVLVLGPPAARCPVTRGMFTDQHRVLDSLMQRDSSDIPRYVLNRQVWCQGDPISDTAIIYVRVTNHTTLTHPRRTIANSSRALLPKSLHLRRLPPWKRMRCWFAPSTCSRLTSRCTVHSTSGRTQKIHSRVRSPRIM